MGIREGYVTNGLYCNKHFSTHLNRIHVPEVVAQKDFFHNFTPPIAEILAFKLCLCCQKIDFSGPISLPQLDISHFGYDLL